MSYKEEKKSVSFLVSEDEEFRLSTLARIHFEGNRSMLCRALIMMSLEDVEAGHKRIGIR